MFGAEIEVTELVPDGVDPGEGVVVLLLVEVDHPFQVVHVPVELEQHLLRVQEVHALLNVLVLVPAPIPKKRPQLFVLVLSLEVLHRFLEVDREIAEDLFFYLIDRFCYRFLGPFDPQKEVLPFLLDLGLKVQVFLLKYAFDAFLVLLELEGGDVGPNVFFKVEELLVELFLEF